MTVIITRTITRKHRQKPREKPEVNRKNRREITFNSSPSGAIPGERSRIDRVPAKENPKEIAAHVNAEGDAS